MKLSPLHLVAAALAVALGGCGSWQRVGSEPSPDPGTVLPRLFDPADAHRALGLLVADDAPRFVTSVSFLAGPRPDSTVAVITVSLSNDALTFRKKRDHFEAQYAVELDFRRAGAVGPRRVEDRTIRVASFAETQRNDPSVVSQQFVRLPPDSVLVAVSVRDLKGRTRSRAEGVFDVPRYGDEVALSSPIPTRHAFGRTGLDVVPRIVVNPRASVPYGSDSLRFYVEAYGLSERTAMLVSAVDRSHDLLYRDTIGLDGRSPVAGAHFAIATEQLAVGEFMLEVELPEIGATSSTGVLVTFSHEWAVANFTEVLSLLRYFGQDRAVAQMREAPVEQRAALWRAFWAKTDPNPVTPEHEAMSEYFRRLSEANLLFAESRTPGWLTDRGEVAVTLGAPDEVFDFSSDLQTRTGHRAIRWNYISERLTLDFVDQTGFGRFRLTDASRAAYLRVLNRIRRSE